MERKPSNLQPPNEKSQVTTPPVAPQREIPLLFGPLYKKPDPPDPDKLRQILSNAFGSAAPENIEMWQSFIEQSNMSLEQFATLLAGAPASWKDAIRKETSQELNTTYRRGITYGLVAGTTALILGFALAILGFTQVIDFGLEGAGFSIRLLTASPGVFFAIVGLIIIVRFKPRITQGSKSTHHVGSGVVYYQREEKTTAGARLAR